MKENKENKTKEEEKKKEEENKEEYRNLLMENNRKMFCQTRGEVPVQPAIRNVGNR